VSPSFPPVHSIVPDESLIAPLRSRHAQSGFRGVYQKGCTRDGHPVYVAKFKLGGSFLGPTWNGRGGGLPIPDSHSTQPHVCALFVAKKYMEVFGERWREVLLARKLRTWQARYSEKRGGFVASVWVHGNREEVVCLRARNRKARRGKRHLACRWSKTDRLVVFSSVDAAKAGIQIYLERLYGTDWRRMLYRRRAGV
jgi:hypothetical protein